MQEFQIARICAVLPPEDPYSVWYGEALEHCGLLVDTFEALPVAKLSQYDVVLLCGEGNLTDPEAVEIWLNQARGLALSRAVVVSGGTWGLERVLGVSVPDDDPWFNRCTLTPSTNALWPKGAHPTLFFGGPKVTLTSADAHLLTVARTAALTQRGPAWLFAPHVGKTLGLMVQGTSVETDALGPDDGSIRWDTGKPKAEYGTRLGFETRREGLYLEPHADNVREIWVRTVLEAVRGTGKQALMTWHLPRNASFGATLTLDCDTTSSTDLFNLNAQLLMTGTRCTILTRSGGYAPDVYGWLKRVGHEVGLTYNTNEPGGWHPDRYRTQVALLTRLASIGPLTSARVADGHWQGFLQPYEAMIAGGARTVTSKGGLHAGTAGALFGTARPFFPRYPGSKPLGIVEVPSHLLNVGVKTTDSSIDLLMQMVMRSNGVLHGITQLSALHDERGAAGLKRWLAIAKQSGAEILSMEKLAQFERTRRSLRIEVENGCVLQLTADAAIEGLTLLVQGRNWNASGLIGRTAPQAVERFGQSFVAFTVSLPERKTSMLRILARDAA